MRAAGSAVFPYVLKILPRYVRLLTLVAVIGAMLSKLCKLESVQGDAESNLPALRIRSAHPRDVLLRRRAQVH